MAFSWRGVLGAQQLLLLFLLHTSWEVGSGQVHYSVPEEAKHGTFVGRIAQDLGLEVGELVSRLFRVVSKDRRDYLEVNAQNGVLFVNSRIDREELCGRNPVCTIHLEVIVEKPLQVFHVEVEIKDINDNPPVFLVKQQKLFILESRPVDSRFPLGGASDADIGANAELLYKLSGSEYFTLDINTNEGETKSIELVLKKSLDREETPEHNLLLTATDQGKPELTGTAQLLITVLDANDNAPAFDKSIYSVRLLENIPNGTLVIRLNASDADEGVNKEILYHFGSLILANVRSKFIIDSNTGEIRVNGNLDYEECNLYEIKVEAVDRSSFPLTGHCKVMVKLLDVNDNAPQVSVTSLSLPVPEDALPGTVIALISVFDRDSGANGQVTCSLSPPGPFTLVSTFRNYYSLVLDSPVDRESVSAYELVVTARDGGTPELWATASVSVGIGDVNDNAPSFEQPVYTVFVKENNPPGCHIFTVSASDPDAQENARVSYSLVERQVGERPLSSYMSVHSESGKVYALQPLDHEELELLQFQVNARDSGFPPLSSNVSLQVFVLDENDNAPAVLPPHAGISPVTELVSQSVAVGHVVAKIRAVDADSGYNAWLSYELMPEVGFGRSPFRVGLYTGEISTTRALEDSDASRHILLVLVKDHGKPVLSATATLSLSLVENGQTFKTSSTASGVLGKTGMGKETALVDVNVYLIIAICSVSSLFVLSLLLYVALRCSAAPKGVCGPGKPTLVCSGEVGSLSYSQQKRQNVYSWDGVTKNDLMAFSPNFPQPPGSREGGQTQEVVMEHSGKVSPNTYLLATI
ncbi:protocadherin alpha-5-like [Notamacropus eugenii]|uniref:protocadherin alpha-5-like n=1 Tax=Notamacropus eugenii TaxID=9315 RepID=UPI003B67228E